MAARSVLVTGCSSGIGLCAAKTLMARGYAVVATARKQADIETLKGMGLMAIRLDLADSASVHAAAEEALALCGGEIYGLVNNAAFGAPGAVEDLSRQAIRAQFETNLFGTMELTNLIIPAMRKASQGRIVMISSILGLVAMKYQGAYNASKHALEGLSDTLRMELVGSGIRVSIIEPGPIRSRIRENALPFFRQHVDVEKSVHKAKYEKMERAIAEGKEAPFTGDPEDVVKKIIHALESGRPKIRYRVTFAAHLLAFLRRALPSSWLYRLLAGR
jgi:NAD(P)-dependent dehydrogenase (short-subunit alcohol dehydrogenase family)